MASKRVRTGHFGRELWWKQVLNVAVDESPERLHCWSIVTWKVPALADFGTSTWQLHAIDGHGIPAEIPSEV
jgi:hypothetical protein